MREQVIEAIREHKIIAIVRGASQDQAVKAADALYEGGIRLVEVTFNPKDPCSFMNTAKAIHTIKEKYGEELYVGAGTVITPSLVEMAYNAGALYIISPDTDSEVIKRTRELGMVSLPGAYTASEVKRAYKEGADFVKIFPCIDNAPAYIKALSAPLNYIPLLAVGGVNADNCADFIKAGAAGVGVGGSLVRKDWMASGEFGKIKEEAKRFIQKIQG